ncbi:MAG TPA: hypothetical protein VKA43_03605 [Gammaproteobacteria bacterium]|nr:hypothetical protein [Gammaproteobacteria bacterium]
MSNRRQEVDPWGETHVLDVQPVRHVVSNDTDNVALYDEYARELEGAAPRGAAGPKSAADPRKR